MYVIYRVDELCGENNDDVRFAETIQDAESIAKSMAEDWSNELEYDDKCEYDICVMISKVTPIKTFYEKAEIKKESGFTILKG